MMKQESMVYALMGLVGIRFVIKRTFQLVLIKIQYNMEDV
jgi:hypothetical protein